MMAMVIDPDAWFIVVNPASGGGRASRFRPRLVAALERAGLPHHCVESAAPGDATARFARAADEGFRRLLAVGGDGTLNELVNGLLAAGSPTRDCLVAAAADGTGDAEVIRRTPHWVPRAAAYLVGLIRTLTNFRAPQFEIKVDGIPAFHVVRCGTVEIHSDSPCGVEVDGQLFGTTPVTVTIVPGALRALDCRVGAIATGTK